MNPSDRKPLTPPKNSPRAKKGARTPTLTEFMKPIARGPVDGNAFAVLGAVKRALEKAGQGDKVQEYMAKATSGNYDNLLAVSMEYVDFDLNEEKEGRP